MKLRIASRKSHLARYQAYEVGKALKNAFPGLEVTYLFRESLGDKNLSDPLWQMPEKGVFTQDFLEDLIQERCDLVVHSWKDLPIEQRNKTRIAATLPRADARDLLLCRSDFRFDRPLKVLCSSPRRMYNLRPFLSEYLPAPHKGVVFESVRGNVPTRLRKTFVERQGDALVVAKAALDRLLSYRQIESELSAQERNEFETLALEIRQYLDACRIMVLPLSHNPSAAAQGALAIEVKTERRELQELLSKVNCEQSFQAVQSERDILASYGGGCHQKIGVSQLSLNIGTYTSLRGLSDGGETLNRLELNCESVSPPPASLNQVFPKNADELHFPWFEREEITNLTIPEGALWIAKAEALAPNYVPSAKQLLWCAGLKTWKRLASRGIWVNGSSESLGEKQDQRLEPLWQNLSFTKLSHTLAKQGTMPTLATYKLVETKKYPDLSGKTHFYWMSSTQFEQALKVYPELALKWHACGPGHTFDHLKTKIAPSHLSIYLDHSSWLKSLKLYE